MTTMIDDLAKTFHSIVRENELCRDHLTEIDATNSERGDSNTCATQDYCDANMLMLEAFKVAFDREPETVNEADIALWNAAWDKALDNGFDEEWPS